MTPRRIGKTSVTLLLENYVEWGGARFHEISSEAHCKQMLLAMTLTKALGIAEAVPDSRALALV